ncbi:MAG: hypothetical protein KTR31_09060 [Myxococcales bacterium]|nr:hypothetical protein [Myxococcales bacterium]
MRHIAFDLDDLLLPDPTEPRFATEPHRCAVLAWLLSAPRFRVGTRTLLEDLQRRGWRICVYTSSARDAIWIRLAFLTHGIWLSKVVNDAVHRSRLGQHASRTVKYPPAFDIDVLVDDSIAVAEQGRQFGFQVVQIDPSDDQWTARVLGEIGSS